MSAEIYITLYDLRFIHHVTTTYMDINKTYQTNYITWPPSLP